MDENIARLEALSNRLNESSDALSKAIAQVEAKLASLRLGVSAWVEVQRFKDPSQMEWITLLMYTKLDSAWRLVSLEVIEKSPAERDGKNWPLAGAKLTPLLETSRELRAKALQHLPALLSELERKAAAEVNEVEKALVAAQSI